MSVRSSQDGGLTLPQAVLLPPTLRQLYDNYDVVGGLEVTVGDIIIYYSVVAIVFKLLLIYFHFQSKPSFLVPAGSEDEVNRVLLADLIIVSGCAVSCCVGLANLTHPPGLTMQFYPYMLYKRLRVEQGLAGQTVVIVYET